MASFFVMQKCLQKPTTRNTHPKKTQPQQVYVLVPKNNMFLPKKKTLPWLFFYTKNDRTKPTNHQTTKPQQPIHPLINSPPPSSNHPRNFPDPCTHDLKNLVQTKRRPVNSSPAVANGAKEGMLSIFGGRVCGWIWIKW